MAVTTCTRCGRSCDSLDSSGGYYCRDCARELALLKRQTEALETLAQERRARRTEEDLERAGEFFASNTLLGNFCAFLGLPIGGVVGWCYILNDAWPPLGAAIGAVIGFFSGAAIGNAFARRRVLRGFLFLGVIVGATTYLSIVDSAKQARQREKAEQAARGEQDGTRGQLSTLTGDKEKDDAYLVAFARAFGSRTVITRHPLSGVKQVAKASLSTDQTGRYAPKCRVTFADASHEVVFSDVRILDPNAAMPADDLDVLKGCIHVGMSRDRVLDLLGWPPTSGITRLGRQDDLLSPEVWRYGCNITIHLEHLLPGGWQVVQVY